MACMLAIKSDMREKQRVLNEWIEERRLERWHPVQIQCPDLGETGNVDLTLH